MGVVMGVVLGGGLGQQLLHLYISDSGIQFRQEYLNMILPISIQASDFVELQKKG